MKFNPWGKDFSAPNAYHAMHYIQQRGTVVATLANSHSHQHTSIFSERPILTGVAVGVVSLLPHFFISPEASLGFAAILIALIAGIYVGFAVVNGSNRDQLVEFNVTGLLRGIGPLGPAALAAALADRLLRTCLLGLCTP